MHRFANPTRFMRLSGALLPWLGAFSVLLLAGGTVLALVVAPPDYQQGESVRIMFVHVPSAWMALFIYALMALASAAALIWRHPLAELAAQEAAPLGAGFTLICLISGSLWGKPMWGTWWVWDARLTSTAILFVTYVGYLLLRGMVDEPDRRARYAAVVGILGAANIPIVHFSVKWWRALHQPSTILGPEPSPIAAPIALTLLVNWIAFTLLFFYFLARRAEIARLEDSHAG